MAERSWYIGIDGRQEGPFPETDLRGFIAAGRVTAETLVWSEGMTNWQRAGDIPGLIAAASAPPPLTTPLPAATLPGSPQWAPANQNGASVTADFSVFGLFGWLLLVAIGLLFVIPAPWIMTGFYRWIVTHLRVPQMPSLEFTGKVGDIWWAFVLIALITYFSLSLNHAHSHDGVHHYTALYSYLLTPFRAALAWVVLRWAVQNVASQGQPPVLRFSGNVWIYIGWSILTIFSAITIIGWAWVTTAWMRWIAAHIEGTPGPVVFAATGWNVLWRTFAMVLGCIFIIPIPWLIHWYARWYVSQFAIAPRTA